MSIVAVLTADNHLGTYYSRFRPDRLQQRRDYLQRGFRQTVNVALERGAGLFLIAGDLFDRPDPRNADRAFVAEQLARLRRAGVAVVAVCGNHDSPRMLAYDGGTVPLQEMEALDGLHLLRDDTCWSELRLDVRDSDSGETVPVRIRGASYAFHLSEDECPLEEWTASLDTLGNEDERTAPVEIVLMHYPVEGWQTPYAREPILSLKNVERVNADLIGVGHLHVTNRARLGSGALLLNPGATERIHFGEETHRSGCFVVTLTPGKTAEAEYVDTSHQPMKTVDITAAELLAAVGDMNGPSEVMDEAKRRIGVALDGMGSAEGLVRLRFSGVLPDEIYSAIDANALRQWAQSRCCHCDVGLDELSVRFQDIQTVDGTGGIEIDQEINAVVEAMLSQIVSESGATPAEQRSAEKKRQAVQTAREALLDAYRQIRVS